MNDYERFMSKVNKTDTCWLWKASLNHKTFQIPIVIVTLQRQRGTNCQIITIDSILVKLLISRHHLDTAMTLTLP